MKALSLGNSSTPVFLANEFQTLDLHDKRLERRAINILQALQENLTSCVRRLFSVSQDMRQAYDFF